MIVNVSGILPVHSLELARQMEERGYLGTFYTASPKSRTARVPPEKTRRHLALLPPLYLGMRQWTKRYHTSIYWHVDREFDRWMAARITPCDVHHVLAGTGLHAMLRAKQEFGALAVCDATTAHVRTSVSLLKEEADAWNLQHSGQSPRFIDRLEAEYAAADLITVPSLFARQTFIDQGVPSTKLTVTPYGADLKDYYPCPKRDTVFRVLFVGTLTIRKGLGYLFRAMSMASLRDAELAIRGADTLETPALLAHLPKEVRFSRIPPQHRETMRDLFSQASVLVLPSVEDAFGLVIGQAMACGVPVIASVNTGGPDLITDGVDGFVVPIRDSRAIAERLQYLHDNPDAREKMASAARRKITNLQGWDGYGAAIASSYRNALAAR